MVTKKAALSAIKITPITLNPELTITSFELSKSPLNTLQCLLNTKKGDIIDTIITDKKDITM